MVVCYQEVYQKEGVVMGSENEKRLRRACKCGCGCILATTGEEGERVGAKLQVLESGIELLV